MGPSGVQKWLISFRLAHLARLPRLPSALPVHPYNSLHGFQNILKLCLQLVEHFNFCVIEVEHSAILAECGLGGCSQDVKELIRGKQGICWYM